MNTTLRIPAPLDPGFQPVSLFNKTYVDSVLAGGCGVPLAIGLERNGGQTSRFATIIRPEADAVTLRYVERLVKSLLWARGGWKITIGGSQIAGQHIAGLYSRHGARAFDVDLMSRIYEREFQVAIVGGRDVPEAREAGIALGGNLDGCRIGFDLGASDYKIAALQDGEIVFSEEYPWDPKNQADPDYLYDHIHSGFERAAGCLPRVDAIGGSSAGTIIDNKFMAASLLRSIPESRFAEAQRLFHRLRDRWQVPMEVLNDGDVTALAGAMSLGKNAILGIAMGSSQAAGYLNPDGRMTGWLSELAFAPVDMNPDAPADEWSGDRGVGVMYFSQQAVNKLLPAAGIVPPAEMGLPERLREVQKLQEHGDERAGKIYETIGVYLGYAIPHYAAIYDFENLLILGRVTTGAGGDLILDKAREVLMAEFPDTASRIALNVPDEKSRRVGQAVAAASLPRINK